LGPCGRTLPGFSSSNRLAPPRRANQSLDLESLSGSRITSIHYPGAILLISHDRNSLTNRRLRSSNWHTSGSLATLRGNYRRFLADKEAREERQQNAYDQQQKESSGSWRW
jgi:ATP-binding cassette subfamily F protein 3